VTLILEGTYPYVRGGVSSWVHDLIIGLPDISFALVYLGAEKPDVEPQPQYQIPPNVRAMYRHFLMEPSTIPAKACPGDAPFFAVSARLHDWFRDPAGALDEDVFGTAVLQEGRSGDQCAREFFHSEAAWAEIMRSYSRFCPEAPFLTYFWAVRNTHGPIIKLAEIARTIPRSRIYHAVSTGYAGLLGAMLNRLRQRPLVLTEHGIYTKERKIELRSLFLQDKQGCLDTVPDGGMEHHEQIWARLFEGIGRLAYAAADPIISLYEQNRLRQISDGADPQRTRIIPNGVDVERYAPLRLRRPQAIPRVLGLIGRVVPIKDIKTFIRAIHALEVTMPDVEGWLIGPEEEDPAYALECRELVRTLQLTNNIKFLGFQRIDDVLPRLGLLVLTSISEAFPLVIGESYASGLPVLTTDVGACRDLVEGVGEEDRALGCGGSVVPIFDPSSMAQAAYELLSDSTRWHAAQQAGIQRVERYYRQSSVVESYRDIYQSAGDR
ncbi:MAG: GT4 family glycosyltransferase PelF, partial [Telluria sp.]